MIRLVELLEEDSSNQKPYIYSPVGFSCAVCSYLSYNKDEGKYVCANENYEEYAGTHYLIGEDGKPLTKELLTKYCSNWFEPIKK